MVTLDLDKIEVEKDRATFRLFGETHTIPVVGYAKALKMNEFRRRLNQFSGEDEKDMEAMVQTVLEVIFLVVPDLESEKDRMKEELSLDQLYSLSNLIFKEMGRRSKDSGAETDEEQKELTHYRQKYGDEYRKGQDAKKGKKRANLS